MTNESLTREKFSSSIFGKIMISYIIMGIIFILSTLSITTIFSINNVEENIENHIMSTAKSIAANPMVIDVLCTENVDPVLNNYLDYIIDETPDISLITVADENSIRFYHYDKSKIGHHFVGGDEGQSLKGEYYLSDATGTRGYQRRAFAPVYGNDKNIIGFVMVSTMMTHINDMKSDILYLYIRLSIIILLLALSVAYILSNSIKQTLMGYEPWQLVKSYVAREDVLEALDEGIISTDSNGNIIYTNQSAASMLQLSEEEIIGSKLDDIICLNDISNNPDGNTIYKQTSTASGMTFIYELLPIMSKKKEAGKVLILRNRTEVARLAEQLTGSKHIISALRANTHEFMNKLHVILGLLQMNKIEDASKYISDIASEQSESITPVLKQIHNPSIAALILGKISHAKELGISFTILQGSHLPEHSNFISTQNLITIIGNLIENSIEAISKKQDEESKKIVLQIKEDSNGILIALDDTGIGMTPEEVSQIFKPYYSTKGENRGIGMSLVKNIVDYAGGTIEIESDKLSGTSITIFISRKRTYDL